MTDVRRPLLRYHGGKWRIAPWIISYFPPHRVYVELFGGGGSVLLRKGRSHEEIYNDLDGEIVNVFRVVRDSGKELQRRLSLTPFARKEFTLSFEPSDDPIEQARRTIVRAFMGRSPRAATLKLIPCVQPSFRSNTEDRGITEPVLWRKYPDALNAIIERLQGVVIENRNAIMLINQHDGDNTLFYADPPYVHSTRKTREAYRFEMSDGEHIKLAEELNRSAGAVIVSGYNGGLYNELYRGWKECRRNVLSDGGSPRTEVLWMKGIEPDLFSVFEE
jgi:DNA adenine methylase